MGVGEGGPGIQSKASLTQYFNFYGNFWISLIKLGTVFTMNIHTPYISLPSSFRRLF